MDITIEAALHLTHMVQAGDVIHFIGDLGSGKTTFIAALAAHLRCTQNVSSPTFTLVHEVPGPVLSICHVDAYRCVPSDTVGLGLDHYLMEDNYILCIEWPNMLGVWAPPATHIVTITEDEADRNNRIIVIERSKEYN